MFNERKKVPFLYLPTPLEYMSGISEDLGIQLYMKRDDMTGLGGGGNKLRKLEYFLHDARQSGATALVTVGGPQTNHGRLTAAVAARYGLKCTIVAVGDYPGEMSANILLDRIMGAEVYLVQSDGQTSHEALERRAVKETLAKYRSRGDIPYFIPLGGSNELGCMGYYECAGELLLQMGKRQMETGRIVCTVGSLGTYMGLFLGLKEAKSDLALTGIAISPSFDPDGSIRAKRFFDQCRTYYGFEGDADREVFDISLDYHFGAYNNSVEEVRKTIYYVARREAVLLDPCYTGKCFYGLIQMVKKGDIRQGETVIFLHTGGSPALNGPGHREAMQEDLLDGLLIKKPEL